jgi:hypothetical protein
MHVLTLPPRHLFRVTLVAAVLALALTALLAAPLAPPGSDRGRVASAGATPAATSPASPTAVRPPLAPLPAWLARPATPPSLGAPGR